MAYTIKDMIKNLEKAAEEFGEETEVLFKSYNQYVDEWEYSEGVDLDQVEVTRDNMRWYWGVNTTGKKLILEAP